MFKLNCRYFLSYAPCRYHKLEGRLCEACPYFEPVESRILLIKLGAKGDVVRTTAVLPVLKAAFPAAQLSWVVEEGSEELLTLYPEVDRILSYGSKTLALLSLEEFDLVYSLDFSVAGAALASLVRARTKYGFGLDRGGRLFPFNQEAQLYYALSLNDKLKRANRLSYQDLLLSLMGFAGARHSLKLNLTVELQAWAKDWAKQHQVNLQKPVVGLNLGAGKRWLTKAWGTANWLNLIERLAKDSYQMLVYGGEEETEVAAAILAGAGDKVIDTGRHNSLLEFGALLNLSRLVVTADSLALHLAVALGKPVIGLFGPTSVAEIELYGRGEKLAPRMACRCCYLNSCSKTPYCTESIRPERVYKSILKWLK
jgi:ADP-heptose:LPS heptosyltransferase